MSITTEEIKQMIKDLIEVQKQRDEAQKQRDEAYEKRQKEWNKAQRQRDEAQRQWEEAQRQRDEDYEKRQKIAEEEIKEIRELQKRQEKREEEALKKQEKREEEAQKKQEESLERQEESLKRREELDETWRIRQEKSSEQLRKRINQVTGAWDHRWGRFIETLVKQGATNLLSSRGIQIDRVRQRVKDKYNSYPLWEIDILAENSILMVAIETKYYLTKDDVDEAIERFQKFKQDYKEGDGKVLYGGVGYLDCEEKTEQYAEKKGLFVFQSVGNSAVIINEKNFKPKAL